MKLDSIIYDINSLNSALTAQLNQEATTFKAIYPSDTATSLVNTLSTYASMLQYQIVSALANCYTDTAYSPTGIYQLAQTLGNKLHGNISAQLFCTITRLNLKGISNIIIPAGSNFTVENLNFFNPDPIIFPLAMDTLTDIKLIQGNLITNTFTSAGISGEKIYFSNNFKCNNNLVRVFVNDEEWQVLETFLPIISVEVTEESNIKSVVLATDPDGRSYIKFGNNSNGLIPAKNSTIKIQYVSNEGADGNIDNNDLDINLITPLFFMDGSERVQLQVDIPNSTPASGGFNTQTIENLRESSPYIYASGHRAIRRNDYKALLLNKCGYLTCNVWGEYEESITYGTYDKIMMNMVYYTGIKSIQKYDLQPIGSIDITQDGINLAYNNTKNANNIGFWSFESNVAGARGFYGSYAINLLSYDAKNNPVSIKYVDTQGTGILTYEAGENTPQNEDLYPINDFINDTTSSDTPNIVITTNQDIGDAETNTTNLINGTGYKSSGLVNGVKALLSFDNPFQIRITCEETKRAIAGFAFKTPSTIDDLNKFIGQFAIYATNDDPVYTNVKNNSNWTRLTTKQTIDNSIKVNSWSDWVTTSVYVPDTDLKWAEYKYYVIEVYSFNSAENNEIAGTPICIEQIKAIYSDSASTIWYTNNNEVDIKIPITAGTDSNNNICLPSNMQFYTYTPTYSGLTWENGYRTGDRLVCSQVDTAYKFRVTVLNALAKNSSYLCEISNDGGRTYSEVLRGREPVVFQNIPLIYETTEGMGTGGTLSIDSSSTLEVKTSYVGNFYTNKDIQAVDLPIIDQYNHFTTYLEFKQPKIKNVSVNVEIVYSNVINYLDVKTKVIEAINGVFDITPYYIGKPLNVSNIWKAIGKIEGIERFNVLYPTNNINCEPYELIMLPKENLYITDILNQDFK